MVNPPKKPCRIMLSDEKSVAGLDSDTLVVIEYICIAAYILMLAQGDADRRKRRYAVSR